jgi:hypothetical protein
MELDLESEMQTLLAEESYLSGLIDQLSELKYRKGYDPFLKDITKLLDELKDKKETIQENIQDITNNIVMAAEVYAGDYVGTESVDNYV